MAARSAGFVDIFTYNGTALGHQTATQRNGNQIGDEFIYTSDQGGRDIGFSRNADLKAGTSETSYNSDQPVQRETNDFDGKVVELRVADSEIVILPTRYYLASTLFNTSGYAGTLPPFLVPRITGSPIVAVDNSDPLGVYDATSTSAADTSIQRAPVAGDTLALWRFDEPSGSDDYIDVVNNITVTTWGGNAAVAGVFDGARSFQSSGATSAVGAQNDIITALQGSSTVEFWLQNNQNLAGSNGVPIRIGNQNQSTSADNDLLNVRCHTNGNITVSWQYDNRVTYSTGQFAFGSGTWRHVSIVRTIVDATTCDLVIYLDGVSAFTASGVRRPTDGSNARIYFGSDTVGAPDFFRGLLDDLRISNTAHTQSQVQEIYQHAFPYADAGYGKVVDTLGYYPGRVYLTSAFGGSVEGTWDGDLTVHIRDRLDNAGPTVKSVIVAYVWRPSTGERIGPIATGEAQDSMTTLLTSHTVELALGNVNVMPEDRIVVEQWARVLSLGDGTEQFTQHNGTSDDWAEHMEVGPLVVDEVGVAALSHLNQGVN